MANENIFMYLFILIMILGLFKGMDVSTYGFSSYSPDKYEDYTVDMTPEAVAPEPDERSTLIYILYAAAGLMLMAVLITAITLKTKTSSKTISEKVVVTDISNNLQKVQNVVQDADLNFEHIEDLMQNHDYEEHFSALEKLKNDLQK